ncbi:MAG: AAA family ATPase [Chloroflexi bacterium]|nr:AAA family ATPase [Chloroflexota bacterium]
MTQPVLLSMQDAFQCRPPITWIIDNFISAGSVNVFYGDAGSKKTWALLDMAVCVARGADWLNFKTTQSNVFIVDEESGRKRILDRMEHVARGHSYDETVPVFCHSLAGYDFGNAFWLAEFTNTINLTNSKFVIIDALADVMPGRDENAVKDVQPIFLALRKIAEATQAAILLIHHSNKNGGKNDYRGSTSIKGAIDLLVKVESESKKSIIEFATVKSRDTDPLDFTAEANFMMNITPKMFWLSVSGSKAGKKIHLTKADEYVLRYLNVNGASEKADIIDNADTCSPTQAQRAIYRIADPRLGLIERTNSSGSAGGRGKMAIYDLTDEGRDYLKNNP